MFHKSCLEIGKQHLISTPKTNRVTLIKIETPVLLKANSHIGKCNCYTLTTLAFMDQATCFEPTQYK